MQARPTDVRREIHVQFGTSRPPGAFRQPFVAAKMSEEIERISTLDEPLVASISIVGLTFDAVVDLSYLSGRSICIPHLIISDCFMPIIDLSVSEISRLEIVDSEISCLLSFNAKFHFGIHLNNTKLLNLTTFPLKYSFGISFSGCRIEGDVAFHGLVSDGSPHFDLSNIGLDGSISVSGCRMDSLINLDNATISKSMKIERVHILKGLTARNAMIDGHLAISDTTLCNEEDDIISAEGLEVGGAILIKRCSLIGRIFVIQAKIGVNLEIEGCRCDSDALTAINLSGATIDGNCFLRDGLVCVGGVEISRAKIGGTLDLSNAVFSRPRSSEDAFNGSGSTIGGICKIADVKIDGKLRLLNITAAEIYVVNLTFANPDHAVPRDGPQWLDLANSTSSSVLTLKQLKNFGGTLYVRLLNVKAAALIDGFGTEYFADDLLFEDVHLRVGNVDLSTREQLNLKLDFMKRNSSKWQKRFGETPLQPYMHLAGHLQASGWQEGADRVLWEMKRAQRRALRSRITRAGSGVFDLLFGYGYGKMRAVTTLIVWLSLGIIGTHVALDRNMLIIDSQAVTGVVPIFGGTGQPQPGFPLLREELTIGDLPCGTAIDPVFYAVELILPVFDLGQKKQCRVRGGQEGDSSIWLFREYVWWWLAKYMYTIGGWIVTSLAVLTIAGSLKSRGSTQA